MGTLHKRTHRPLARRLMMMALFALLGVAGWQLPQVGRAALAYSNQALKTVFASGGASIGLSGGAKAKAPATRISVAQNSELTEDQAKQLNMLYEMSLYSDEFAKEELYILNRFHDGAAIKAVEADAVINRVLYNTYVTLSGLSRAQNKMLRDYKAFVAQAGRRVLDEESSNPKGKAQPAGGTVAGKAPAARNIKASPNVAITSAFGEGFDDITTLPGAGWSQQNLSSPLGVTNWFQGNSVMPSQAGAATSYIGANFRNTGDVGTISNWLLTPEIGLKNGDQIKFWTRKPTVATDFPDRLEVRLSTAGASTNVGATATSVGDFTTLLLSINPTLTTGVYPQAWTQFTVTISGLGAPTTGRVGFRYFVTNGGEFGSNSDFIGIDTFEYAPLLSQAVIMGVSATLTAESCTPANNAPDPGETVTISMCLKNTGATAATNIVATLTQNPSAGVLNPSAPQSYGAIPNDGNPVCRSFTFTVPSNTVCGGTVTPSFTITDNGTPLAPVSFTLGVGTTNAPTTVQTFTQNTLITIPAVVGNATPYPSALTVAGVTGTVVGVKVKLNGVNHTFPDDVDVLLVGPTGAGVVLMSDAGGGTDLVNTNFTFADGFPYMPDATTLAAGGTFAPTNHGTGDVFSAPAPSPIPAGGPLNALFAGQNPNGTWNLFVTDQFTGDGGSITSWQVELTTTSVTPIIASTPFTNATAINLPADPPGSGSATPYPSNINVSGVTGQIINIGVTLNGVSHTFPNDIDLLLVGPTGVGYTLLSDVGGGAPGLSNITFTLQDSATPITTTAGSLTAGTFRPTNSGTGDTFPAPAPGAFQVPPSAGVASLLGTYGALNANGTWSLYAVDDLGGDTGALAGGWTLTFRTINYPTTCSTCPTCTITPPANITVANDANQCGAVVNYPAPTTSGTCGTVTCSPASGSFFPKGTTTVQCISSSGGGFSTFTVTVNDTQAPVITCPANITVPAAAGLCTAVVTFALPVVSDNCPGVGTPVCVPASGATFQKGTTTVNCSVSDASGNPSACSFTVTVNDTQAPAITCPANIFVGTAGTTQVVTYPLPVVSDNCPGVQVPVCVPASGSAFALGVTTVNCSVRDAVNNPSTCAFQVTVNKVVTPTLSDPLACTGPGNVVNGSFAATNTGGAAAAFAATVTFGPLVPYPQLLALPGTCVTNFGTCTVVNPSTISVTASVPAGATINVSYKLQVADGVLPGTVLTSTVVASFNGGPPLTTGATLVATCQAPGPGPLYPAASEVSDQKPGSVLVYPIYTSNVGANTQNSRISITNTHLNLRAWVHLFFVSDACAVSDAFICLTPNQTSTFLASDLDPGTTGYLVAIATDGLTGCPINFNYLIGDAYVKFSSGHAANLGAESISALAGSAFFAGCSANAVFSTLSFDGVSYNRLPYVLAVDNIGSRADGNDTIVVLDRIGGDLRTGPSGVGNVFGVFYNDAEALLSFTLNSTSCQYRFTVNNTTPRITPRFEQFVTAGRTGWMKFYQRDGAALLGSVINYNPNAVTSAGAFSQGHNLHKLTLTDTASYIIPVFPPSC